MGDKFLYENRPALNEEFRKSLYFRLNQSRERENLMDKKHVFRYSLTALVITLVLVFTISAPVRANVIDWIRQIAGFNVVESTESPMAAMTEMPATVTWITPHSVIEITDAPFAFTMPQFLPEGFALSQNFAIANSKTWISLNWTKENYEIDMQIEIYNSNLVIPADKKNVSQTTVNGQEALLIRGGWMSDSQWNDKKGLELQWLAGDLRYDLQYYKTGAHSEIVPFDDSELQPRLDELMKVAESIK
jgi:hypothetical protein